MSRLLLCLLVLGCGPVEADHPLDPETPPEQRHRARLSGQLVLPGGAPVAKDALVRLFAADESVAARYEESADAEGAFRFDGVDPGLYRFGAAVPGYVADDRVVLLGSLEHLDLGRVLLRPAAETARVTLRGRAVLQGAASHLGVTISVGEEEGLAFTAPDGRFILDVRPGSYTVAAEHPGYSGAQVEVEVGPAGAELAEPLTLVPEPGAVRGSVTLRRFASAARRGTIVVQLTREGEEALEAEVVDGAFAFTEVPQGAYGLEASAPGYDPVTRPVGVAPGAEVVVDPIDLPHASTGPDAVRFVGAVSVLGDGGAPAGTRVELSFADGGAFASAVADVDGAFAVDAAPDERYRTRIDRDGFGALMSGPFAWDAADERFEDEEGDPVTLELTPSE